MLCKKKSRSQAAFGTGRPALRSAAGFTLVELIVVIAILGILAGVGTVAYSGYIAHTNKQLDENLKNEIIYAGAVGHYADPDARGTITVTKTSVTVGGEGENQAIVEQWMEDAFGADWKETVRLRTDKVSIRDLPLPYGTVSEATAAALQTFLTSNFAGKEEALLENVSATTTAFSDFWNSMLEEEGRTAEGLKRILTSYAGGVDFLSIYGLDENSSPEEIGNATVLYVASRASELTVDDLFSLNATPLDMAAANLGMLTAYVNSDSASIEDKEAYKALLADSTALAQFAMSGSSDYFDENEGFWSYIGAGLDSGETSDVYNDTAAYLAALSALNEYSGEFSGDLTNESLFSNAETLALIQTILGSL